MTEPPDAGEPPKDQDVPADDAPKPRRQRGVTIAAIGAAIVVGALLFSAGGRSTSPTVPATTPSAQTPAVTTGPSGPTAPTASVAESTAVGPDTLAIGSSGTFSTEDGSGVVTVSSAQWQQATAGSAGDVIPVIEVEIQLTSGQFLADPANFALQDSKNHVYQRLSGAVDGELASGQLLDAGQQASGQVAFDVPRQPLTLVFTGPDSKPLLTWRMPE